MPKVRRKDGNTEIERPPFQLIFHDRIPEGMKATHWDSYRMLSRFGEGVTLWYAGNEDTRTSVILHHHESRTRWRLVWGADMEKHGDFMSDLVKMFDSGMMG